MDELSSILLQSDSDYLVDVLAKKEKLLRMFIDYLIEREWLFDFNILGVYIVCLCWKKKMSYYDLLGIAKDHRQENIPQAFRANIKQVHPDKTQFSQDHHHNK